MANLMMLLNILKVAVGLGFVIFIHELGHFVLAKWNGVKVEKFSIGFGRTIFGFRRGETEYVLAAIPLGGFVRMLGEGPEDEANKSTDPRAYPNKSVGARMAIISAGVIMNVFLGLACFVYAYGQGLDEVPAKIGAVKPGSPAYEAGLRPGDEIVAIDGRRDISFNTMTLKVFLSGVGQKVDFDINRPGRTEPIHLTVEPRREESDEVPKIGVTPTSSLILAEPPFIRPPGMDIDLKKTPLGLLAEDHLVALGPAGSPPQKVGDAEAMRRLMTRYRSQPLEFHFERRPKPEKGKDLPSREVKVILPPTHVLDFGFRLTIEPISSVRPDSPASKAGFRVGDKIVKVDDDKDFDPIRLPEICFDHAGSPMTFEVERPVPGEAGKRVTLEVTPDDSPAWNEAFLGAPHDVPGLGLSYPVRPKIASVIPGSPAEKAKLGVGDVISKMTVVTTEPTKRIKTDKYEFTEKNLEWPAAFWFLQVEPTEHVELTVNGSTTPRKLKPEPDPNWFNPSRGLVFQTLVRRLPPQNVESALRRGFDDTVDNILRIYAMLRSLVQKRVSPKLLGGPIMIARVAYSQADTGLTELVHFLGILSINLAVLNFLPVPPLDGGQFVFLAAEKIRGRPLPDSAVIFGSWVGIGLLLCLMAYVMCQDILRLVAG